MLGNFRIFAFITFLVSIHSGFAFGFSSADSCGTGAEAHILNNAATMNVVVAQKIQQIMQQEKSQERDFKIGIIQRRGLDIGQFRVLKTTDEAGAELPLINLLGRIEKKSSESDSSSSGGSKKEFGLDPFEFPKFLDSRRMDYSHIGFIIKNHGDLTLEQKEEGAWLVVHLLDPCSQSDRAQGPRIRIQSLNFFFEDELQDYTFKIVVPSQELQNNLEKMLLSALPSKVSKQTEKMKFVPKYYNISTHWTKTSDGNSNSWPLETIAAAASGNADQISSRDQAIDILKNTGYKPTIIIGNELMSFAAVGNFGKSRRMDLRDQPFMRTHKVAEVVSAMSVDDYLKRIGHVNKEHIFKVPFLSQDKSKTLEIPDSSRYINGPNGPVLEMKLPEAKADKSIRRPRN